MNRDDLEAVIWRHSAGLCATRTADRYAAMNAILAAARDYATDQCLTAINAPHAAEQAARRAVLERAARPRRRAVA